MLRSFVLFFVLVCPLLAETARQEFLLEKNWQFSKGDVADAAEPDFDSTAWQSVTVPHDWAIYGPFDMKADQQNVAIAENFEQKASVKTGRTGALPFVGVGWYRTKFDIDGFDNTKKSVTLQFDGAMGEPKVFVNGKDAGSWAYGYNSFFLDVTDFINSNGKDNVLAVRLENLPESARWYPGAGLFRNVHVIVTNKIHVPVWGTYITTPVVNDDFASVQIQVSLANAPVDEKIRLETVISEGAHTCGTAAQQHTAKKSEIRKVYDNAVLEQHLTIDKPRLWSPETPNLYTAVTCVYVKDELVDEYVTRFGVRDIKYVADKGFFLNGKKRKFQGVCNHHDLGPLGAAVNVAAIRRQLTILKNMGCDSVRTSHNMPAPELVNLCDELGLMLMVESFDEWKKPKCRNGYNRFYDAWAEKDLVNMVRHYRNNPSVVMWSIGNETSEQVYADGYKYVEFLQGICHREDPTRPVTFGMNAGQTPLYNRFADTLDIPGMNYRTHVYEEAYQNLRQNIILGSETASTISSRGEYMFPAVKRAGFGRDKRILYPNFQNSSYDLESCFWSNIPDVDFALAEDFDWTIGQFVCTGFDYLVEPTPYDSQQSPNHSSMFGIIDLASIPKDRYYLYRSVWKPEAETLHIVPHWNWNGKEGQNVPVFVYTNYPSAELFINGKSQGRQTKASAKDIRYNDKNVEKRYRLMWLDTKYEPGELKVAAYNSSGKAVAEKTVKTAGAAHHLELIPDRTELSADGKDLSYINVRVVDKDGNFCATDNRSLRFSVSGSGSFRAAANGDPTSLELFHLPTMRCFNGQLTAIVQTGEVPGEIIFEATADGLDGATIRLKSGE
jgi:beta-galactosidase